LSGHTENTFLKLDTVTKRRGDRTVVSKVSFEVEEGQVTALLGPSGCGKTTLLRLIAGLEQPDEGEIWIGGERVAEAGRNLVPPRKRGLGFVFQDLALWPHFTVTGNLNFVLASAGFPKSQRAGRIEETLRLARVERFAESYPGQLSGGEQQRVALARALVTLPRLILLDEPLSSLDADLKSELLRDLKQLLEKLKITTLYVTHDHSEARYLAQRVVEFKHGQEMNTLNGGL